MKKKRFNPTQIKIKYAGIIIGFFLYKKNDFFSIFEFKTQNESHLFRKIDSIQNKLKFAQ
jgi:hypothetical protein